MAKEAKSDGGGVVETIKTIVYALLLAGLIRTLFFQPFWIPSGSMKPTLLIGDFLFVNKMSYGYSWASCPQLAGVNLCGFTKNWEGRLWAGQPERGDVIVFKHPVNGSDFIKRLIGLPGDRVQMRDGQLFINDKAVPRELVGQFSEIKQEQGPVRNFPRCKNQPVALGAECVKDTYRETLPNGVVHTTLDIANSFADTTSVYSVPADQYLFIGDNRDNSQDGRFPKNIGGVGFVSYENLVGRADRVIFSSAGTSMLAFWTWRSDRYFKGIE